VTLHAKRLNTNPAGQVVRLPITNGLSTAIGASS
jgi:hypothetical protein